MLKLIEPINLKNFNFNKLFIKPFPYFTESKITAQITA